MRLAAPSPKSPRRLARIATCLRLGLTWVLAVVTAVFGEGPIARQFERDMRGTFDKAARALANLILIHASARFGPRVIARVYAPPAKARRTPWKRAAIGSALRCALRGKNARDRIATLIAIARDPEAAVVALLKRLPKGLTRRRVFDLAPHPAPAPACAAAALNCARADTS